MVFETLSTIYLQNLLKILLQSSENSGLVWQMEPKNLKMLCSGSWCVEKFVNHSYKALKTHSLELRRENQFDFYPNCYEKYGTAAAFLTNHVMA